MMSLHDLCARMQTKPRSPRKAAPPALFRAPDHSPACAALDLPLPEDALIESALPSALHHRWQQWLSAPRLRYLIDADPALEACRYFLIKLHPSSITARRMQPDTRSFILEVLGHYADVTLVAEDRCVRTRELGPFIPDDEQEIARPPQTQACLEWLCRHAGDGDVLTKLGDLSTFGVDLSDRTTPGHELEGAPETLVSDWMESIETLLDEAGVGRLIAPERFAELRQALKRREHRLQADARRWLRETMDADCLAQLQATPAFDTLRTYNWLVTGSALARSRRMQALATAPAFLDHLLHFPLNVDERIITLTQAVDAGDSLIEHLGKLFGIRPGLVRRLMRLPAGIWRETPEDDLANTLRRLDAVPPAYWPRNEAQMRYASASVLVCDTFAHGVGDRVAGGYDRMWACGGSATRQLRRFARSGWSAPFEQGEHYTAATEIADTIDALCIALEAQPEDADRVPLAFSESSTEAQHDNMTEPGRSETEAEDPDPKPITMLPEALSGVTDWSFRKWRRISQRWHLARHTVSPDYPYADQFRWPPLIDRRVIGQREVVFLETPAALEAEGRHMAHCVGARVVECLFMSLHIASLRELDGTRCSTVALSLLARGGRISASLEEHQAARNGPPSPACQDAVALLLQHLNEPEMQARLTSIHARMDERMAWNDAWRHNLRRTVQAINIAACHIAMPELMRPPHSSA